VLTRSPEERGTRSQVSRSFGVPTLDRQALLASQPTDGVAFLGWRDPSPSVVLATAAQEGLDASMIDFRFTAKNLDWRVVAVVAALLLALSGEADSVLPLAGEFLREWTTR
jgi:hypothetical protein